MRLDLTIWQRVWNKQSTVRQKIICFVPKKRGTVPPFDMEPLLRGAKVRRPKGNELLHQAMRK